MNSIIDIKLGDAVFCVLDFETTGLSPDSGDRVVEIALVRYSYKTGVGESFSTLINPQMPIPQEASKVHGIYDKDVKNAPFFSRILRNACELLDGTVLVGHNVYFDLKFLVSELKQCGFNIDIPHICTMSFPGFIGGKTRQKLQSACAAHGVSLHHAHSAFHDTVATAQLFNHYLSECFARNIFTFRHLKETGRKYKFITSWATPVKFGDLPLNFTKGIAVERKLQKKAYATYHLQDEATQERKIEKALQTEGCFIATAVYGTADCGNVCLFRHFRDIYLLSSGLGRTSVNVYYALSPRIATFIRKYLLLRLLFKIVLDIFASCIRFVITMNRNRKNTQCSK